MLAGGDCRRFVLVKTKFGYHVYATGSNGQARANAGINTRRVKIMCFIILGGLTGLAATILIGWMHGTSRGYGQGYELDVIAAVVIGGTNLFGGIGSVFGTFLGAAITGMMKNGLVLLGASKTANRSPTALSSSWLYCSTSPSAGDNGSG